MRVSIDWNQNTTAWRMTVKSDCPVMLGLWGSSGPSGLSKVQFHHRWAAQVHAWASAWEPRVWAGPAALENPLSHSPLPPELPLRAPPECSRSLLLLEPQSHCDNLVTFISRADALDIRRFSHHSFSTMNGRGGVCLLFHRLLLHPFPPTCGHPAVHPGDSCPSLKTARAASG